MRSSSRVLAAVAATVAIVLAGCGDGADSSGASGDDRPVVVVTTSILGDVVENLVGDQIEVVTIMPAGSDPHAFQASAQQAAQIGTAAGVIANGAGFEESLLDLIESAEDDGVPTFEAISVVDTLAFDHDEHDEDEHGDVDPHFFTDPARVALAADAIVEFLIANVAGLDSAALQANAAAYIDEIESLDAQVETALAVVPPERRVLVTNHEVFGYFADRYGFEIAGTIVPGGSTTDTSDARTLADLADLIEHEGVPAIFADTSSPGDLASTLAGEVGDIDVIELFSESLGADDSEGATYLGMVRTNAERIAAALAG